MYEIQSPVMGRKARDTLTGYKGTIIAHTIHLTGCDTVCLGGGVAQDGRPREGEWFDLNRIELIGDERWTPQPVARKPGACAPLPRVH